MREKRKPVNHNKPAKLNIITGDDMGFVSVTMTRREPSAIEKNMADLNEMAYIDGVRVYFVIRGKAPTMARLIALAAVMLTTTVPWDDGDIVTVETLRDGLKRDANAASDEPGMDFANDPVWQRILAVSGGER